MAGTIDNAELKRHRQHKAKDAHDISNADQESVSEVEAGKKRDKKDLDSHTANPNREKHGTIDTTSTD
jgi:hypothetical protein